MLPIPLARPVIKSFHINHNIFWFFSIYFGLRLSIEAVKLNACCCLRGVYIFFQASVALFNSNMFYNIIRQRPRRVTRHSSWRILITNISRCRINVPRVYGQHFALYDSCPPFYCSLHKK